MIDASLGNLKTLEQSSTEQRTGEGGRERHLHTSLFDECQSACPYVCSSGRLISVHMCVGG